MFRSILALALLMTEITAARTGFGGDTPPPAAVASDQC